MLTITIPGAELFNETTSEFLTVGDIALDLEHSLVALSKWEQIWEKPFLTKDQRTPEELFSYIRAMVLTPGIPDEALMRLSEDNLADIQKYLSASSTATWFNEVQTTKRSSEVITAELIYFWMMSFQIPFQPAETWHLNRLFTLIKICNVKNSKPKKQNPAEAAAQRKALNDQRRAQMKSKG